MLHFVHNPETEARREAEAAQISQLQAEVAALRAQLAVLQSDAGASDPAAPAAAVAAAEKTLLERKVCNYEAKLNDQRCKTWTYSQDSAGSVRMPQQRRGKSSARCAFFKPS